MTNAYATEVDNNNVRWLTPDEKEREVSYWLSYRENGPFSIPPPEGELGGLGYPDPEIFALTDRLNAIDGVCTVQSCAGHRIKHETGDYVHFGQLWLRLSEDMSLAFYRHGFEWRRANQGLITQCAIWFQSYDNEVVDIRFNGLEVSPDAFAQSARLIGEFFEALLERSSR